jgi:hypothetical protein
MVHIALLALILGATFGTKAVPLAKLVAPSPDSYALSISPKIASGGGGDHDHLTAPKGRLPEAALQ